MIYAKYKVGQQVKLDPKYWLGFSVVHSLINETGIIKHVREDLERDEIFYVVEFPVHELGKNKLFTYPQEAITLAIDLPSDVKKVIGDLLNL